MNCLFDNAASCCLMTERAAKQLNLQGQPISLDISTAIGSRSFNSFVYTVPLIDRNNNSHSITAIGVDRIADYMPSGDVSKVKHLFSSDIQRQWDCIEARPTGEIELLVGLNFLGLHPTDIECVENLKVSSSIFGNQFILSGTHQAISTKEIAWHEDVSSIRHFSSSSHASINNISVKIKPTANLFCDDMGVQPPRRCNILIT